MAWFFRVIESDDGSCWACRFGRHTYDTHTNATDAIAHIRQIAAQRLPAQIYLHPRNGTSRYIADIAEAS